ncbi:hypothetical protein TTHERM_00475120 (macronuclear) [Tetrahymena thermophila SB210]|uniref:Uncharacterized protein n=1 Tax=Tetrahymena thermophila (strain SB210) TaxID=312017 RepID=I7MA55_TETTS|nr:hypothetical protein TTHERM_00475120 [Tetrahymena thermophila SB210]EAS03749.2 hypothetical protein TTHERM_00475120 [Tetrahymena thermophila SB210]|eukprot:XP_001023994.2 hypothetical protein TTHERM_00475120 [Tetrahymena thermophila SB210]
MKLFFQKTVNLAKDTKEDPLVARKRQIEEQAKQMKINFRQEFQKMENNKFLEIEQGDQEKFEFIEQIDQICHQNQLKVQQLVELKRVYQQMVEDNKEKLRKNFKQNWNGQNTFTLTALQSQSVQRPQTSYQCKNTFFSRNNSIPDYFSIHLNKDYDAVNQRLEEVKTKYECISEEIFKEEQKQLEILKMQEELVDKDKRLREKLFMTKRMIKLAQSRYSNVERIEFRAGENKKQLKRNVLEANNNLLQTQQIGDAFLEKKKQIQKELKREIVLEEDLFQHNFIKLEEKKIQNEEVKKQLEQVIIEEKEKIDRENEFYIVGQHIWVLEIILNKLEQEKLGKDLQLNDQVVRQRNNKRDYGTRNSMMTGTPLNKFKHNNESPQTKSRSNSLINVFSTHKNQVKLQNQDDQFQSQQHNSRINQSPPKLSRKEILNQIEKFFDKYNIERITEAIIKDYNSKDLENQMNEIMYKTETQHKISLTHELFELESQLNELKNNNEFLNENQNNDDKEDKNNNHTIINNFLEQDIAMDAGRLILPNQSLQEIPNKNGQQQNQFYQTVNQTIFSTEESQKLEKHEQKVKRIQSFLVHLFLSAKEYLTRLICITQTLQDKCSDKFSSRINSVLKEISLLILGKLPNQIMPKTEKAHIDPSVLLDTYSQKSSLLKSQPSINLDEIAEANFRMKNSLNSLSYIEDLELVDVISDIQDEKLRKLSTEFLENIKKSSLLKYFVQSNVVSSQLKRLAQLYFQNPEQAIQKFYQFEDLKYAAQLQIRIRFRQMLDGFTKLYQQIQNCKEEGQLHYKVIQQIINKDSDQDQERSINEQKVQKVVRFNQEQQKNNTEDEQKLQIKETSKKIIDKIQSYQNSNEEDYLQKFEKMDLLNEQRRINQEMIQTEQEQKSQTIIKIISQISEKKTHKQSSSQNQNISEKQTSNKKNEIQNDSDYIDEQRQNIKQKDIDLRNDANKKGVKKKGFYSKELGFASKPIEVFERISKTYNQYQIEEIKNVKQVATESSLLFKIDQLDSQYDGQYDKKISGNLQKQKQERILFFKKEFQHNLSQGYLKLNNMYHMRREMSQDKIKNLKNIQLEKSISLYQSKFDSMRPSTTNSNFKTGGSQISSIYSKKSNEMSRQESFNRKKINTVQLAQQINDKLIKQGYLKNNNNSTKNILNFDIMSQGQTGETKSIDSFSRSDIQQKAFNNHQQNENNDYFIGKFKDYDTINEDNKFIK